MNAIKRMNAHIKDMWVEALRSGNYRQGQRWLCADDAYCCLGVLCEVMGVYKKDVGEGIMAYGIPGHTTCHLFPSRIALMIGLGADEQNGLVTMNDSEFRSFAYIADWIEENL